jgi:diadenosine tetraphosphate (Ap4A) HIT family hydrolase
MMFQLHDRLTADTLLVGDFPLCLLLLSKDANYPWTILVPKREGIAEIYQLNNIDRQQLLHESCVLAEAMQILFSPDKLNIATMEDAAWPGPVWGAAPAISYSKDKSRAIKASLQAQLANELIK